MYVRTNAGLTPALRIFRTISRVVFSVIFVFGAGGLGQMLKYHLSLFQMQQAASVIIAMLLMVGAVDAISFWLRRVMTR